MRQITIDWSAVGFLAGLWDVLCREGQLPNWRVRNSNALNDSWVRGGIDSTGPPYDFKFINCDSINPASNDVAIVVVKIARDSVQEVGGACSAAWPLVQAGPAVPGPLDSFRWAS